MVRGWSVWDWLYFKPDQLWLCPFPLLLALNVVKTLSWTKAVYTKQEHSTILGHLTLFSKKDSNDSNLQDMSARRRDNISVWLRHWLRFLTGTKSSKNTRFSEARVMPLHSVLNRLDYFVWLWASLYRERIANEIPSQPPALIPASVSFFSDTRPPSHMHVISVTRQGKRKLNMFKRERSGSKYKMQAVGSVSNGSVKKVD